MRLSGFFMAVAFSAALSGCGMAEAPPTAPTEPLSIQTHKGVASFKVEIADDDAEREKGLMFRKSLADDRGMLFIFPEAEVQSFWMKNTLIPLDIIYIGSNGKVVSIAPDTTPLSEAGILSKGPARYVLELRAGRALEIGLEPGDKVTHQAIPTVH